MFKKGLLFVMAILLLLGAFSQMGSADGTRGTISHTDNERDVDAGDFDDRGAENDIDILSISVDDSSDPIVFEMLVKGDISYTSEEYDYGYYFYVDHTGNGNAESTITIQRDDQYITTQYGSGGPSPITTVTGDGSEWLDVEIPLSQISGSPGIVDIWAFTEVEDGQSRATDDANRNFGGVAAPDSEEDPKTATPTDPSVSVDIDDFDYSVSVNGDSYDFTQAATGTTQGDIVRAYYCIAYYDEASGSGTGSYSWEMGPIDEEHEYGGMTYEEEFMGTGPGGSWSTWEWSFHSTGPIDDSNRQEIENPDDYYQGAQIMLFVRAYSSEGWNQDSMDITDEIMGTSSGDDDISGDDDTSDDDSSDDDDEDDDSSDDDDEDDGGSDDSPGFGLALLMLGAIGASIVFLRRRK